MECGSVLCLKADGISIRNADGSAVSVATHSCMDHHTVVDAVPEWMVMQMDKITLEQLIDKAAEAAAAKTVKKLKDAGRITYVFSNSFKKTEELLYLYPKLPEDHPERQRINQALEKIADDDYKDVIASRYFDGLTIMEISEIYDCKYQNISKKRNKLVKILAAELFPEDVLREILQK